MTKRSYYFDTTETDGRQIRVTFDPDFKDRVEVLDTDAIDYGDGWSGEVVEYWGPCDLSSAHTPEAVEKARDVARSEGLRLRGSGRRMSVAASQ